MLTKLPEPTIRRMKRTDLFKGGICATWEIHGLTAERGGDVLGYAGIQRFNEHYWAFFNAFDVSVLRPFWLHRLVKDALAAYERANVGPIYSLLDDEPTAPRWHQALGFRPLRDDERDDEVRLCESINRKQTWIKGGKP